MKKSKFNLSHQASLTASMGNLIPFVVIDCLPNDSHRLKLRSFVRAQPMLAPLMHKVNLYAQYWFVPYRLLWNDWETFITGGESGNENEALIFPTIKVKPTTSSLADYFGLPVNNKELEVSAFPFRAMVEIWNTRYRDQDLQDELPISYEGGLDTITNTGLLRCSWAKDRFTTARPFTQRGAQIAVPVNSLVSTALKRHKADVHFSISTDKITFRAEENSHGGNRGVVTSTFTKFTLNPIILSDSLRISNPQISFALSLKSTTYDSNTRTWTTVYENPTYGSMTFKSGAVNKWQYRISSPISPIVVIITVQSPVSSTEELSTSASWTTNNSSIPLVFNIAGGISSVNIRDLRTASAVQRYQERSLEYGNRYEEFIQREFGIKPRDSRIQRPEYLGGGASVLQISEVLQTAEAENSGVGTMRGHGVSAFSTRGIRFRASEHGVIIGLLSIRPNGIYTQGVEKFWRKFTKFDYYIPELANIGMQEIWQSELFANGENFNIVFGYEPRYEEYRKMPNRISGEFRKLLNFWNLAREFDTPPTLNSDFITMKPSKRVFAEQTQDSFLIMLENSIHSFRPLSKRAKNILR